MLVGMEAADVQEEWAAVQEVRQSLAPTALGGDVS